MWRPRLGIALGGGAARGLAHLGVLEVLEEAGIRPAAIAGTSMGALVGGLWASTGSARAAIEAVESFVASDAYKGGRLEFLREAAGEETGLGSLLNKTVRRGIVLGWTFFSESFVPRDQYWQNVEGLLPERDIENLSPPFAAMATDLKSGEAVVFRSGPLRRAVVASGALPGLMPPEDLDGRLLVDGAISDRVPTRALLAMPVDVALAVDVSPEALEEAAPKSGADIVSRSKLVTEWNLRQARVGMADLLLRPDVADIHWADFSGALPAIERGRDAMRAALPELRRVLRRAFFGRMLGRTRMQVTRRLERRGYLGDPAVEV